MGPLTVSFMTARRVDGIWVLHVGETDREKHKQAVAEKEFDEFRAATLDKMEKVKEKLEVRAGELRGCEAGAPRSRGLFSLLPSPRVANTTAPQWDALLSLPLLRRGVKLGRRACCGSPLTLSWSLRLIHACRRTARSWTR